MRNAVLHSTIHSGKFSDWTQWFKVFTIFFLEGQKSLQSVAFHTICPGAFHFGPLFIWFSLPSNVISIASWFLPFGSPSPPNFVVMTHPNTTDFQQNFLAFSAFGGLIFIFLRSIVLRNLRWSDKKPAVLLEVSFSQYVVSPSKVFPRILYLISSITTLKPLCINLHLLSNSSLSCFFPVFHFPLNRASILLKFLLNL